MFEVHEMHDVYIGQEGSLNRYRSFGTTIIVLGKYPWESVAGGPLDLFFIISAFTLLLLSNRALIM